MKKAPLYSRSPRRAPPAAPAVAAEPALLPQSPSGVRFERLRRWAAAWPAPLWALAGALFAVAALGLLMQLRPGGHVITQDDIDAAVRESLEKEPLPSAAAKAYDAILPSVVRVVSLMDENDTGDERSDKPDEKGDGKRDEQRAM